MAEFRLELRSLSPNSSVVHTRTQSCTKKKVGKIKESILGFRINKKDQNHIFPRVIELKAFWTEQVNESTGRM